MRARARRRLKRARAAMVLLLGGAGLVFGVRALGWDRPAPVARDPAAPPPGVRVTVEILNGGGVRGQAGRATEIARDRGFDVVYFGNADSFDHVRSEVLDRVGRPELARSVAAALGIDDVRSEPDPNRYVDVSVVLGSTWSDPTAGGLPPGR